MGESIGRDVLIERPTPFQWDEVIDQYGKPEVVSLRRDLSYMDAPPPRPSRACGIVMFISDPASRILFTRDEGDWFLPLGSVDKAQTVEEGAQDSAVENGAPLNIAGMPAAYVVEEVYRDLNVIRWFILVDAVAIPGGEAPGARFFDVLPEPEDKFMSEWLEDILSRLGRERRGTASSCFDDA
ncbi:hypothetical protein [Methanomassiliicoccus luminyensis]|jgi:hypothetical protein|uniref:hypothetical protein n=1 Tax=Methanomassiliicoccus luminyensis TaxID=1080712 RepID=UPI00036D6EBA|nr:hypothetical protein [Methanomassiliicoccus luminyensis]